MDKVQRLEREGDDVRRQLRSMKFKLSNISHSNKLIIFHIVFLFFYKR